MTKQDICYEIILQFRQYIFWDYTTIEVYDSGPEYGLIFFSKKNNRKISFNIGCWENQANFFIEIEKIKTPFFQLVGMNKSNKYKSLCNYFKDDIEYNKLSREIRQNNYTNIIEQNIIFLSVKLNDVIRGRCW